MTTKFKTYLMIYFTAILTPFVTIVFFLKTGSLLVILPVLFFAWITLIISTVGVIKADSDKPRKKYYWITAIIAVILFHSTYVFQLRAADWIFFKSRENKLTTFITEIKRYDKIKQMSDGQRYWKSINSTLIEANITSVDTSRKFTKKYFLDDILKRDGIDKKRYERFRNILVETDLISFTTLNDGTISFTIDGFMDNCYGIAYSETGIQPNGNDCGRIIRWTKIGDNWYAWGTT
jgi:hypothetical protein